LTHLASMHIHEFKNIPHSDCEHMTCIVSIRLSTHHHPCLDVAISVISAVNMRQCTLLPASPHL